MEIFMHAEINTLHFAIGRSSMIEGGKLELARCTSPPATVAGAEFVGVTVWDTSAWLRVQLWQEGP